MNKSARVEYDRSTHSHRIVVVLDADEAEAIAGALGASDSGATELYKLAAEARAKDEA